MKYLAALLLLFILTPTVHTYAQRDCALPGQLVDGEMGEVRFTDGTPLNIRTASGIPSNIVGTLNEGERFEVDNGSYCDGNIRWWYIQKGSVKGWIAESQDDIYYVRPIAPDVVETEAEFAALPVYDLAADSPTPTSQPELTVEIPAEIDGYSFVNALPSPDQNRIAWLYRNCTSNFGCAPGTGYVLSITDNNGEDRQVVWQGAPMDVGIFRLTGWRTDSSAVFMTITDTAPYPEPGSPIYSEPGYPPQPDWFEIPLDGSAVDNTYTAYAAISADGEWRVTRNTGSGENFLHIHNRDESVAYDVPYPGYWLSTQFSFSPQNESLVWVNTNYINTELDSVSLNALDLQDGTVKLLYDFPAGYPFPETWLDDTTLLVEWVDLQRDVNYTLRETLKAEVIFDVTSGDIYQAP